MAPGAVTVTLPSVTVTVWFLYKTAEWISVLTVPSVRVIVSVWFLYTTAEWMSTIVLKIVSVEKAVTVAVTFRATGRQVELWVGWGQPLEPVPVPLPWLLICPGRLWFHGECEYVGRL